MSSATYSRNPIVNRAISATTTVNSNSYAIVYYSPPSSAASYGNGGANVGNPYTNFHPIKMMYGPGQTVPSTIAVYVVSSTNTSAGPSLTTVNYTLTSGVEFTNG